MRCKLPVYEYQCSDCNTKFERRQRFDDEPVATCPECAGKARRVIHSVPVFFKGSGFYCTDNGRVLRGEPGRNNGDKEEASETKTESKSEAKPQAQPQTATATKSEDND